MAAATVVPVARVSFSVSRLSGESGAALVAWTARCAAARADAAVPGRKPTRTTPRAKARRSDEAPTGLGGEVADPAAGSVRGRPSGPAGPGPEGALPGLRPPAVGPGGGASRPPGSAATEAGSRAPAATPDGKNS